jgi:hypothetical protein
MEKRLMLVMVVIGSLLTSALPAVAEMIEVSNRVYWVRSDLAVSLPKGSTAVGAILCKEGDVVVGGGFESSNYQVYAVDSRPIWQGWEVTMFNTSDTQDLGFDVYAICMKGNIK